MTEFSNLMVGTVAVIPLVMGLVQFAKRFGVDGNWNIVLALVFGVVFSGVAYGIDQSLIPVVAIPYIKWAVFALAGGLSAAGFYDIGKTRFGTRPE